MIQPPDGVKYDPCGGCGADHPSKACIGCRHPFARLNGLDPEPEPLPTPSRYRWTYKGVSFDFYRLCEIVGLKNDAQKHTFKKIIRAGLSVKPVSQEIDEAIDALRRWKEMLEEDNFQSPSNLDQIRKNVKSVSPERSAPDA